MQSWPMMLYAVRSYGMTKTFLTWPQLRTTNLAVTSEHIDQERRKKLREGVLLTFSESFFGE